MGVEPSLRSERPESWHGLSLFTCFRGSRTKVLQTSVSSLWSAMWPVAAGTGLAMDRSAYRKCAQRSVFWENHLQLVQGIRISRVILLLPLHSFMGWVRAISPAAFKYPDRRYRADWFSVMDVSEQTAVQIFFYCHVGKNIFWKAGNYQTTRRSTVP